MIPIMSDLELRLFESLCRTSDNYLEFGSGGSTFVAAGLVQTSVTTIDSSVDWLERADEACRVKQCRLTPNLVHIDIGPTREWGFPTDPASRYRWPAYYEAVWTRPNTYDADLFLVDGRFRVASCLRTLLNCRTDALIMIHDFSSRARYHSIKEVAREIARAEDLSVFIRAAGSSGGQILRLLEANRFDPR